jgi:hypothetical protein
MDPPSAKHAHLQGARDPLFIHPPAPHVQHRRLSHRRQHLVRALHCHVRAGRQRAWREVAGQLAGRRREVGTMGFVHNERHARGVADSSELCKRGIGQQKPPVVANVMSKSGALCLT